VREEHTLEGALLAMIKHVRKWKKKNCMKNHSASDSSAHNYNKGKGENKSLSALWENGSTSIQMLEET